MLGVVGTVIPEKDHLETEGTDISAQLRRSLVHKSSVRQSDGSQRLTAICRKVMYQTHVWIAPLSRRYAAD
ncbi:hypothetical protein AYI68_g2507 [Smittium mucronatum]|uniref:Uncharacterized protein n=1 Tax=Smittium mucronatum TaxID=133383 RepID=A0A1R0H2K9_9FUNG|nr:hypothetical protein AYI68_g2507 [Smittium mucronatum]